MLVDIKFTVELAPKEQELLKAIADELHHMNEQLDSLLGKTIEAHITVSNIREQE